MKRFNKLAVAALALAPFAAKAEGEPNALLTALQADLTAVIADVTAMQVVVFGGALGIVVGFVVYRLIKSSANKLG